MDHECAPLPHFVDEVENTDLLFRLNHSYHGIDCDEGSSSPCPSTANHYIIEFELVLLAKKVDIRYFFLRIAEHFRSIVTNLERA